MIPPSGSGRSAPLPAMTVAMRKVSRIRQILRALTPWARCGAERPHQEGGIIPPLLGRSASHRLLDSVLITPGEMRDPERER